MFLSYVITQYDVLKANIFFFSFLKLMYGDERFEV